MVNLPLLVERTYGFCPGSFTPACVNRFKPHRRVYGFDVKLYKVASVVSFPNNFISLVLMVCRYRSFSPLIRGIMDRVIPKHVTMTIYTLTCNYDTRVI